MQPKTLRRGFLRATATLALGKLLQLWQPRAAALAQTVRHERSEKPAQKETLAWSNPFTQPGHHTTADSQATVKLVVTNMATNEQSYLVLDMNERYLVELSVT